MHELLDIDKDWIPVILAVVGPTLLGVGWWFKTRREDHAARELAHKTEKLKCLDKIEELQNTIFEMQQKRIEDETNKRREVDTSVKLMTDMTTLLKATLAGKEKV